MSIPTPTTLAAILSHEIIGYVLDRPDEPGGNALDAGMAVVQDVVIDALATMADNDPLDLLINIPDVNAINAGATVAEWLRSLKSGDA